MLIHYTWSWSCFSPNSTFSNGCSWWSAIKVSLLYFRLEIGICFHNFTPSPPLSLHKITFCRYLPNCLKICVIRGV
ncbi:hypothetical protein CWI61_11185 [Neisseria meningitidis]|nr:hypothetical protein CWI59_00025 [Neisseria meningitidis]PKT90106.1 hypothetical protein CWI61_11185 [Neisseria meningitidis]